MSSHTDLYPDQTDKLLKAAARRARLAPLLSRAMLALAVGLVGTFIYQSGLVGALLPKAEKDPLVVAKPEQITGQSARLAGFDREQQPYELTSKRGYQDKDKPNLVHMEEVIGTFRKASGKVYHMTSGTGLYDSKTREMDLEGSVKIEQPGKFTARMDKAHVSVENKDLVSDVPVVIELPSGRITANGLRVSNNGKNILFLNGVKAHFKQSAKKGGESQ